MSPSITHVILTYNNIDYLSRAINYSISQEGMLEKEILIIDDGSAELVEPLLKNQLDLKTHNIRIVRNKNNIGIYASLKRALNETTTKYVHLGSSNDEIKPKFFKNHIRELERNNQAAFSFGDPGVYHEKKGRYSEFYLNLAKDIQYFSPEQFLRLYRKTPFHIGSNTAVHRTECLREIGFLADLELY